MPMAADLAQRAFAIHAFLKPAERFLHRFAFLESYFCQSRFTSSPGTWADA
jgi:hypothetical protein